MARGGCYAVVMLSYVVDTDAVQLRRAAESLFPVVSHAAQELAVSREVPPGLPAVVEQVYEALPDPTRADASAVDPYLVEALTYGVARCFRALAGPPKRSRAELRIALEQVRQALAYIVEEEPVHDDASAAAVAAWLIETVEVPQRELAEVLGVNPRTLQRWAAGESTPSGVEATRLRTLARVVNNLRHVLTGTGVLLWLREPHRDLRGKRPSELLGTPEAYTALVRLAARARSTVLG